jgi:hypothetical protein
MYGRIQKWRGKRMAGSGKDHRRGDVAEVTSKKHCKVRRCIDIYN